MAFSTPKPKKDDGYVCHRVFISLCHRHPSRFPFPSTYLEWEEDEADPFWRVSSHPTSISPRCHSRPPPSRVPSSESRNVLASVRRRTRKGGTVTNTQPSSPPPSPCTHPLFLPFHISHIISAITPDLIKCISECALYTSQCAR